MLKPWMKHFYKLHTPEIGAEEAGGGGGAEAADLGDETDMDWLFGDDEGEPEPEPEPTPAEGEAEGEGEGEPEPEPEQENKGDKGNEEVTPEAEPEPEPEPEPEKPDGEAPTAEEAEAKRQEFLAEVEKEFAISEEDANLIISEPEKVLPRMAAQIYDKAMRDSAQMIQNALTQVPTMMSQVSEQQTQAQAAQEKFIELNPQLVDVDKKELDSLVESYAPLVAKQYPNATPDEKMQALGRTIAAAKNIAAAKPAPRADEQPVPPHTPAAPVRSGGDQGKPAPANESEAFIDMLIDNQDD